MGCACKVGSHIDKINKMYGSSNKTVKTDIRGIVNIFLKKMLILFLCIIISPLIIMYLLIRKIFTNKPFIVDKFVKRRKNVRNK